MQIRSIREGSTAARSPLRPGDVVRRVNGVPVTDFLDLYFHLSEEEVELDVERPGDGAAATRFQVQLSRTYGEEFGLEFPETKFRVCGNKCPFCFVDQNPAGMRKAVYVRDDDYRFSFLDGHFITLTNLKESDFRRIIDYHLSPLYVSVHALDPEVRTYLLGTARARMIRPQIERLLEHGIKLHTQIVALPGVNDGAVMDDTIDGLFAYYPGVESIGVVPIGLTAHMPKERGLRPYTPDEAAAVCDHVQRRHDEFRARIGKGFVYMADEFLLLAGKPIPATPYYDGFIQLGNGVGMVRELMNDFRRSLDTAGLTGRGLRQILALSGESAGPTVARMLAKKVPPSSGITMTTRIVVNETYGRPTSVTGLLGGKDFARELEAAGSFDLALIPPNALNDKGLFIDDVSFDDLNDRFGGRLHAGFDALWDAAALRETAA
jgi:putative radical SAM enzyme (TIGR03279 family)